ncbi:MAG: hypothetical protein LUG60_07025 [Erysipelotrichaceae bacterium]|nr:hypothetical protein [Erysipelotrichaceae bacterium]
MVTKSVTFLNDYLRRIGFSESEYFLEEELDSNKEDDNPHCSYYVVSYREMNVNYMGIEFPFDIEATIRPKTDEIFEISIKTKDFEVYSDEHQEIIAKYLSDLTIKLSSLISDDLYQKIADGTYLQSMCQEVFAYIKEGRIKKWHDHKGILDYGKAFPFNAQLYDKPYIGKLYFYMLDGFMFTFSFEFHKVCISHD